MLEQAHLLPGKRRPCPREQVLRGAPARQRAQEVPTRNPPSGRGELLDEDPVGPTYELPFVRDAHDPLLETGARTHQRLPPERVPQA